MNILKMILEKFRDIFSCDVFYINGSDTLPPPLTRQEEEEVFKGLMVNEHSARDMLIVHNLRLVVYIAKKF